MHIQYNKPKSKQKPKAKATNKLFKKTSEIEQNDITKRSSSNNIFLTSGVFFNRYKRCGYGTPKNLFNIVEPEITTDCNLKCINCNRSCRQAPSKERMTLESIQKFVEESLSEKHKWKLIEIIGGEPTLHPELNEIFNILKIYKDFYPKCNVRLSTNGFGNEVKRVIQTIPKWIKIRNAHKKHIYPLHIPFNNAPIDNNLPAKACYVPWICGLGLTRNGYYPCGAGASIDRVFQFNIGIKDIKDLTFENIVKQLKVLCLYCGHNPLVVEIQSKSWKKAYKKYNKTNYFQH